MKIFLFVALLFAAACGEKVANKEPKAAPALLPLHCYKWEAADGSKMLLSITEAPDAAHIKGKLDISIAEKDANTGTFTGKLEQKGSLLVVEYTFMSEGVADNKRMEVFMRDDKGDSYLLGSPPVDPATGLPDVRDLSLVSFDPSMSLRVAPCK